MECRLASPSSEEPTSGSSSSIGNPTHSLYLPLARLQSACESCSKETASTRSLSRKLLRLRCPDQSGSGSGRRVRSLFESLGGPSGLGAEGLEQLCNFVTMSLSVSLLPGTASEAGTGTASGADTGQLVVLDGPQEQKQEQGQEGGGGGLSLQQEGHVNTTSRVMISWASKP